MENELTIYIGFDSSNYGQELAWDVCERSIRKFNKNIKIIKLVRQELIDKNIFTRTDNTGSTEFTYTRFLVPYLNNYKGWALFCDSDFLWNCDIIELYNKYANNNYAVCCVKHDYTSCNSITKMDGHLQEYYPRKNWSSLMLFNCSHPSINNLNPVNVSNKSPKWLHRMEWCDDNQIGEIDKSYNYLVGYYEDIKHINAYHFTDGGPWHYNYRKVKYSEIWLDYITNEELDNMLI
jgi:hypothetical protein